MWLVTGAQPRHELTYFHYYIGPEFGQFIANIVSHFFRNTEKVIICDLHKINATIQVALNVKNIPVSDDFMYGLE